jgi:catechol 2,3-dioxygenase
MPEAACRPETALMSLIETTRPPVAALPTTLRLGAVHLAVADLDRAVAWYQRSLGLRVHSHDIGAAELGDGVETVVVLHEDPQARRAGRHAGLYHYALLYPTREELARAAVRLASTRTPIQGASDHRTHEAIYLPDADGNGIELAWDRDREQWPAGLGYDRGPGPLDFDSLLNTVAGEQPRDFVGEGLSMGHLHLHVGDIERALGLYRDILGFEVQANLGSAAFVSAGGYHHHLGVNVWNGHGVDGPPPHTVGLRRWTVQLPTDGDVAQLRERVEAAGLAAKPVDGGFEVRDPWGTALAVVATAATGLRSAATVATAKPSPYLLQTAKHFRHKLDVRFDEQEAIIPFAFGHAQLRAEDGELRLDAFAQRPADLRRVEQVVGSHLERFGRRDELTVAWTDAER